MLTACGRAGRFVRTGDVRYAKLRPFLESAVTWFRKPFALLFVVRAPGRALHRCRVNTLCGSGLVGKSCVACLWTLYVSWSGPAEKPQGAGKGNLLP